MFTRHQPQPGVELAAVGKLPRISDRRDHGCRHQRTDAFDFNQSPTPFVLVGKRARSAGRTAIEVVE
jgi:hypothetical protein